MAKKREADLTHEFKLYIEERLPGVVVLKHCDRFTTGIPDLSVSAQGNHTVWLEVKHLKKVGQWVMKPKTWVDNLVQLDLAVRLGARYLVLDPFHADYLLVPAEAVYHALHQSREVEGEDLSLHTLDRQAFYGQVLHFLAKELRYEDHQGDL